jgi:hypothetical protein
VKPVEHGNSRGCATGHAVERPQPRKAELLRADGVAPHDVRLLVTQELRHADGDPRLAHPKVLAVVEGIGRTHM